MYKERKLKITVELPDEASRVEFTYPRDLTVEDLVTVFRTMMSFMSWHPDVTESVFKRDWLVDHDMSEGE